MSRKHLHLVLDFYFCRCGTKNFTSRAMRSQIVRLIKKSGCRVRGSLFDSYGKGRGYTLLISLSESHLAVVTWPEYRFVNIDIFICNYSRHNADKAAALQREFKKLFHPQSVKKWELRRGP